MSMSIILLQVQQMTCVDLHSQVNQAMKLGVPVVATGVAVEGMHVTDGKECMVADSPAEFARKVAQVYTSCDLWQSLASEAFENVEKWFSVETAKEQMLAQLGQLEAHRQAMLASTKRC
jgi:glycosyltransferase involved in cell wall biosynthesis